MSSSRESAPAETQHMSYPSPSAEGIDSAPFYNTASRDEVQEHQEHQEQPQERLQHEVQDFQEHQQHTDTHPVDHDQTTEHDPADLHHDSRTPQQHVARPTNLEELQLAAQLGQGLTGTPIMPTADPSIHVEDPNLRNIMPHSEPDQHTPSYTPTHTPDHMNQHPLSVPMGPPMSSQYSLNDGIPPRKRSKVSRACDECRRKKIKCDAQSDASDRACSSCARSNTTCLFSRVPQKRGPSKGFVQSGYFSL